MSSSLSAASVCATACVLACAGCGDGDDLPAQGPADAAASLADASAVIDAAVVPPGVHVENTGAACTTDAECRGADATCLTRFGAPPLGVELPAGYCTARCTTSSACGRGGGCPLGDLISGPPFDQLLAEGPLRELVREVVPLASLCWDRCGPLGLDPCRAGYVCRSTRELIPPALTEQLGVLLLLPALWTSYCVPPVELPTLPDAGARDAAIPDAGADPDAGAPSVDGAVSDPDAADAREPAL